MSGILCGFALFWALFRIAKSWALTWFAIISTCVLFILGAGLFSNGVWDLERQRFNKTHNIQKAESGGHGSWDISNSVWYMHCRNPLTNDGWAIANTLIGWHSDATKIFVTPYVMYWAAVVLKLRLMQYKDIHGHYPWKMAKKEREDETDEGVLLPVENRYELLERGEATPTMVARLPRAIDEGV